MKNVRFLVLAGLLLAALGAAFVAAGRTVDAAPFRGDAGRVATGKRGISPVVPAENQAVIAQGTPDRSSDRSAERRVMVLDGRGSHLGVTVQDTTGGVRIESVDSDSPASKAGLKEGDIVAEFDGERVRSARQFTRLVQETADGRSVKIGIVRGGQKQTIEATPQAQALDWSFEWDGDRIRREFERGMRGLDGLRAFRFNPRDFDFRFDDMPGARMSSRGRLGVTVETLTPQLQEYFGAKDGGVLVSSVTSGSAAAKAGLKAGDVITSINGDAVRDAGDLVDEINQVSGTDLTIGLVRDKKATTVKATLEAQTPRRDQGPRQPAAYVRPV